MARIDAFLKLAVAQGCSDLHLAVGVPPMMRMHGDLIPIKFRDLGDVERSDRSILSLSTSPLPDGATLVTSGFGDPVDDLKLAVLGVSRPTLQIRGYTDRGRKLDQTRAAAPLPRGQH